MEIFGIGLPELIMILVVALIVLGPDRLPEAARSVGKAVADIRRATEPARAAWTELTNEVNTVVSTATLQSAPSGNPWEIHPILAKMTPEEREIYMAGGEMPPHVAEELEKMTLGGLNGRNGSGQEQELPQLDYPMPHGEPAYQPAPPFQQIEDIYYPEPGKATKQDSIEEEKPL